MKSTNKNICTNLQFSISEAISFSILIKKKNKKHENNVNIRDVQSPSRKFFKQPFDNPFDTYRKTRY